MFCAQTAANFMRGVVVNCAKILQVEKIVVYLLYGAGGIRECEDRGECFSIR